jgi:hypothetical protein
MPERTDYMSLGGIVMGRIAGRLALLHSASVAIDSRITSLIISRRGRSIAVHLNALARCSTMCPFVSYR